VLNKFDTLPAQTIEGLFIETGEVGAVAGVIAPEVKVPDEPQALIATTDKDPGPEPAVTVIELVPCPEFIVQPVPETDQV
jgi:hypothetical protein